MKKTGQQDKKRKLAEISPESPTKSALHKWTNDANEKQAKVVDKKQHLFACAVGANPDKQEETKESKVKDFKNEIVDQLSKLMNIYSAAGDRGKQMGYRRAISNIKAYAKPITEADQMDEIPFVGDGIKKKVKELIEQGKMTKLENLTSDKKLMILEELAKIWGVGPQAAQKLYQAGIRSIADLRKKPELLLPLQQIGLKYFEDFNQRMPRDEATAISKIVHDAAFELFGKDNVIIETCGSYRRGKQSCGDVDILMTRKDDKPINGMLEKLIVKLEKDDFLKERLGSTRVSDKGSEMYMGVCKLKDAKLARRIDIKVYPKDQYGFAILYFTGSDYFNRSMRLFAEKKGFTLSDHGLAPIAKSASKQKVGKGIGIPCLTEQQVFDALGLPYKTPAERDV